ncbi:TPA: nodulation protein NfeD [bacterium]|nr:nodulation protein NfeD [bacterium]
MYNRICFMIAIVFVALCLIPLLAEGEDDNPLVYIIKIQDTIGKGLSEHISRSIDLAKKNDADALLFDIHTPGGALDATGDIIKTIEASGLPTIAYVNNEAISAGAIITLSCDRIAINPGGTIGDAQPIPTNEKTVSYVRGRMYSIAEKQNRNPDVAIAMVDKNIVLVKLDNNEIKALSPEEYADNQKNNIAMKVISPQGNVLTISADQATELGIADVTAKNINELLNQFSLAEIKGKKAIISNREIPNFGGNVISSLSRARTEEVNKTIPERISIFFTNPFVASILIALGVIGMIIEFKTPGFGVAGAIGLTCIALFFAGHMIARIDAGIGLAIFVVGVGLLVLEIFVIPGFGVAGVFGIALMFFGLLFTIDTKTGSWGDAIKVLSQSIIIMIVLGAFLAYFLPKTNFWKSTVLQTEETTDTGYTSSETASDLQGKIGVTISPLRPAGVAIFKDERVNVVSDGSFIDKDVPVEVVKVEGGKIIVRSV